MTLEQLRALLQSKLGAVKTLKDASAGRPMTKEEQAALVAALDEIDDLKGQVTLLEREQRTTAGAIVDPAARTLPAAAKDVTDKPFKSFGDFLIASASVAIKGDMTGTTDNRLVYARGTKAAGANETTPSEGGFLVQEDFSYELLKLAHEMGAIMSRVTEIPISSNSNALKLPIIDETSRARGSRWGGVRAYWLDEGEQKVDSKPKFGTISLALNKLAALGYATDELLQDSNAIQRIMLQAFAEEIRFEVEDSIINGNGTGKPLGILNSGAVIVVNKEVSQVNGTITFTNLVQMMDRLPVRSRRNAVWIVADSQVETALYSLTLPGGAGFPIYLPPGQNAATQGNSVFGTLLGRPVIPVEYLPALGTVGDIMLVDLSEYITITKGGIQSAESMHVRFIYDEMTFRLVYRIDGQPAWRQPVTTANGAVTKSPFVALQTR